MDLKLQGQRVLVTGGSRGIGLAIAQAFAAEGAMPIIASRDAEQLAVAVKAIHSSTGITATAYMGHLIAAFQSRRRSEEGAPSAGAPGLLA